MAALIQAIRSKRWRQARLLIEAGSDINWRDHNKRTPLMEVCFLDDELKALGLAKMLLENGAELNFQDAKGLNTLSHACLMKRRKLVDLFLRYIDYDLNSVDKDENTALFHAITVGELSIVKLLVRKLKYYSLSVDTTNGKGETPLIHALKMGHMQCADVLIKEGKASLGARDMVHHRSAAQWKNELQRKGKRTLSAFVIENKTDNQNKQKSMRKSRKTISARRVKSTLPRLAAGRKSTKCRPLTAPDRIPVSDFFQPSTPIQEDLPTLYGIYNQQTTSSYRKGYKFIPHAPTQLPALLEEPTDDQTEASWEQESGKTKININQVKDINAKLKGLHKVVKNRKSPNSSHGAVSSSPNEGLQISSEDMAPKSGKKRDLRLGSRESKELLVSEAAVSNEM